MANISTKDFFSKGKVSVVGSDNQHFEKLQQPNLLESAWNAVKGYGSSVAKDYYKSANEVVNNAKSLDQHVADLGNQSGNNPFSFQNPKQQLKAIGGIGGDILQAGGHVVDAVFAPITEAVSPVVSKTFSGLNTLVDKLSGVTPGTTEKSNQAGNEQLTQIYNQLKEKHPEAVPNVEALFKVLTAVMGEKAANTAEVNPNISEIPGNIKSGIRNTVTGALDTAKAGVEDTLPTIKNGEGFLKNVKTAAEDVLSPIDESVITELQKSGIPKSEIAQKLSDYKSAAGEAMRDNSKPTPMELTGDKGGEALGILKEKMTAAAENKTTSLQSTGRNPVDTSTTNTKFNSLLKERLGSVLDENGDIQSATGRKSIIANSPSDVRLVKQMNETLRGLGENPTLQEVNDAIDSVQAELYKTKGVGAEPINGKTEGLLKEVLGNLNEEAKNVGGEQYRGANSEYADIRNVYDILNKGLGTDTNKGASLMKQLFSPNGTLPRKLFADIKRLTGIDLVNDATLAKFAMENSGDVRQASLLKQVLNEGTVSKAGITKMLIDHLLGKLQDPMGRAERIIQNRPEDVVAPSQEAKPTSSVIERGTVTNQDGTSAAADLQYVGKNPTTPNLIKVNNYQNPDYPKYITKTQIDKITSLLEAEQQSGKPIDMKTIDAVVKKVVKMEDIKKPETNIRYEKIETPKKSVKVNKK